MEDNVYDILKNAPKGLPLYSPMIGKCELCNVSPTRVIIVRGFEINEEFMFGADGKYRHVGECMLFPAKGVGWDKWQCALISPGDIVEAAGTVYSVTKREPRGDCDVAFEVCDQNGRRTVASYESLSYSDEDECIAYVTVLGKNGYSYDGKGGVTKTSPDVDVKAGRFYVCTAVPGCGGFERGFTEGSVYKSVSDGYIVDDEGARVHIGEGSGEFFREWTIRDAVRGDVLAAGDWVFIYSGMVFGNGALAGSLCGLRRGAFVTGLSARSLDVSSVRPASEEERGGLHAAMCENGCMWDTDTLGVVKIYAGDVIDVVSSVLEVFTVCSFGRDGFVVAKRGSRKRETIGCVQKVKVEEFDPDAMKPFDRVLVRDSDFLEWEIAFFGRRKSKTFGRVYVCQNGAAYSECMPFNEYTECYLGKSGEYSGMYRKW